MVKAIEKKEKKKLEFSKIILIFSSIINLAIIVFACIMMVVTRDLSPLAYLIPSVAAEMSVGTAFYYNKAKLENKLKLMAAYGISPMGASDFNDISY